MGYGDDIMATAQIRQARLESPDKRIWVGDGTTAMWSPVFDHSPHLCRVGSPRPGDIWVKNYTGHRPYIDYPNSVRGRCAFTDWRAEPGELFFNHIEEVASAKAMKDEGLERKQFIVVEPHIKGGFAATNKDWGWHNWVELMHIIYGLEVAQFDYGKPILEGAVRVATPNFRIACAVLRHAAAIVTTDGGLHHAAAALGVPGVVIWGGFSSPKNVGYDIHENIYVEDDDTPCGSRGDCEHCRAKMESIKPFIVGGCLEECLNGQRTKSSSRVS